MAAAPLTVGVLALQGAFHEHMQHLALLPAPPGYSHVAAIAVRSPAALAQCHALVIPGGESTAIALAAQRAALLEPLRAWVRDGRPTWGTCAGMILLAREAAGGKRGGQHLLGGIDVRVGRNGFGTQVASFETPLYMPALSDPSSSSSTAEPAPFPGVFIRAPIVESLLLPSDISAVPPGSATLVGRGEGEAYFDAVVEEQGLQVPGAPLPPQTPGAQRISVAPPLEAAGAATRVRRPPLEVLATLATLPGASAPAPLPERAPASLEIPNRPPHDAQIVALRQGRLLATSFHPELTTDPRLHAYFLRVCVLGSDADVGVPPPDAAE